MTTPRKHRASRWAAIAAVLALSSLVGAKAVATAAPAKAKTVICGQIKKGPHATYTSLLTHRKLSGTTWTVFATGVPCAKAMSASPAILRWWKTAKVDAYNLKLSGFGCTKESDGHGSSGTIGCTYSGLKNIELIMTGTASIADLKRMFFIS
jgi:hypothetical protein